VATRDVVTRTMVELADTLVDDFDVVDLLTLLTDRCVEAFDVEAAGLMLAAPVGGKLQVMASSTSTMRDLELYEIQSSDGPCIECYRTGLAVSDQNLDTTAQRWPLFTPAAKDAGFRSVSAVPMRLRTTTIGALNLFRTSNTRFSASDQAGAQAFADVATIAILQHRAAFDAQALNEQLNHALNSRILIEQAKGRLAERAGIDVNEAFDWFRAYARSHNLRLVDVAQAFLDAQLTSASLKSSSPGR